MPADHASNAVFIVYRLEIRSACRIFEVKFAAAFPKGQNNGHVG